MPKATKATPAQFLDRLLREFPKPPRLTPKLQESLLAGLAFARRINNWGGSDYDLMQGLISARTVAIPVLDSVGVNLQDYSQQLRTNALEFIRTDSSDTRWVSSYANLGDRSDPGGGSSAYPILQVAQALADARGLRVIDTPCFLEALFLSALREERQLSPSTLKHLVQTPLVKQIRDVMRTNHLDEASVGTLSDLSGALTDHDVYMGPLLNHLLPYWRNLSGLSRMEYAIRFSKNMEPFLEDARLVLLPSGDGHIHIRQFDYGNTYVVRDHADLVGCKINLCSGGGVITWRDIEAFEFLINRGDVSESDFQRFFEQHPAFLLGAQYHRLHSQVALVSDDGKEMIPDFFAERVGTTFADIIELKTPSAKLIRGSHGRRGFASTLGRALDQVRAYRNYFDNPSLRNHFHQKYGFEAFRPTITVVIGRTSDYLDHMERIEIADEYKNLQLLTYNDILLRAKNLAVMA